MEFIQITDTESAAFYSAMEIYAEAFPPNEQQPLHTVKERVEQGLNQLYAGRMDAEIVFMAMLWPLKNTDFILLDYMATGCNYRGKNIGSGFLQSMREVLETNKKYLILEAENPQFGENKEARQKRINFYKRNGAKELKDVKYILPALDGSAPTEMILMMLPGYNDGKIDVLLVKQLITQIYKELYHRDATNTLLNQPVFESNTQIELI